MKVVKVLGGLYKLDLCISIDDLIWFSEISCTDNKDDIAFLITKTQTSIEGYVKLNYLNGKVKIIEYKFYVPTYACKKHTAYCFSLRSDVELYIKDNIQPKIDKLIDVWANHKEDIVVID